MSDFECLFQKVWAKECPPEVLADWLMEKWDEGFDRLFTSYEYRKGHKVHLSVYHPAGLPESIGVAISELAIGLQEGYHFQRDTLRLLPGYLRVWMAQVG